MRVYGSASTGGVGLRPVPVPTAPAAYTERAWSGWTVPAPAPRVVAPPERPARVAPVTRRRTPARPVPARVDRRRIVVDRRIVDAYLAGMSVPAVAREFGVWPAAVRRHLAAAKVALRDGRASNGGRNRIPVADEELRALRASGLTLAQVAAQVGMSPSTVSRRLSERIGRRPRPPHPLCRTALPAARPGDLLPLPSDALAFVRRRWTWLDEHQCRDLLEACAEAAPTPARLAYTTGLHERHALAVWLLVHPGEGTGS